MSKENVEIVGRAYAALNRGDVDGALMHVHPDAEFDWSESRAAEGGMVEGIIGREQLRKGARELLEVWDEARWGTEEVIEVSADQVLAVNAVRFRGRDGIELGDRGAELWTFDGGKAVLVNFFPSKER